MTSLNSGSDPVSQARSLPGTSIGLVIIGASDSVEAVTELIREIPPKIDLTFICLALGSAEPDKLSSALSESTSIEVRIASSNRSLEKGHLQIIPRGKAPVLKDGILVLESRLSGVRDEAMLDNLLSSAAEQAGQYAIGVLLDGPGTDGIEGLRAIRSAGGIALVQAPTEGGERSARALVEGFADRALKPSELAKELVDFAGRFCGLRSKDSVFRHPLTREALAPILRKLLEKTGVDFAGYKLGTLQRRVARRMALLGLNESSELLRYLDAQPTEAQELFEDLLIHVTSFFRDPETYDAVSQTVLPAILKGKKGGEGLRVWVPGCSTGEEVYSIAIVILEALEKSRTPQPVQIFASDISERALVRAREGLYPEAIRQTVTPERLRKYFTKGEGGYRIAKRVRDLCIFVRHDLSRNPSFSRLDLVSCKNLLIYFEEEFQRKAIDVFHFALRPGGHLILGPSESVDGMAQRFERTGKDGRIHVRKAGELSVRAASILDSLPKTVPGVLPGTPSPRPMPRQGVELQATDLLLSHYVPATLVVNQRLDVLHVWGRTTDFIEIAPGKPELNLVRMLRKDLRADARLAIHQAGREGRAVRRGRIQLQEKPGRGTVTIDVEPLPPSEATDERFFVVILREAPSAPTAPARKPRGPAALKASEGEIASLRTDLAATIEYSQSFVKEYESVNASLSAANEEIVSTNEEIQSTNEELETAKEELQGANEELLVQNQDLARLNADLTNLLSSSETAVVMLDAAGKIRRVTVKAQTLLGILPSDQGRPIFDLRPPFDNFDLNAIVSEVLQSGQPVSKEVRDREGHWHALQVRPYRLSTGEMDGSVLSLHDIDALKRREEEREQARRILEESEKRFRRLADSAPVLIWMSGTEEFRTYFNKPWLDFRGRSQEQELGNGWAEGIHPQDYDRCQKTYLDSFRARAPFETEYRLRRADGQYRWILDRAVPLTLSDGTFTGFIGISLDVTERKEAEEAAGHLAAIVESSDDAIASKTLDGVVKTWNKAAERLFGFTAREIVGKPITLIIPEERLGEERDILAKIVRGQKVDHFETVRRRKNGALVDIAVTVSPILDSSGRIIGASKTARDITERKRGQAELERLHRLTQELNQGLETRVRERTSELEAFSYTIAHDLRAPLRAIHRFSDLLLEDFAGKPLVGDGLDYLKRMAEGAQRMDRLIEDLLDYSRVARTDLSLQPIRLSDILSEIQRHIAVDIEASKGRLHVSESLPVVLGDKTLLTQALTNLLLNAFKFVSPGTQPEVKLTAERRDGFVRVAVRDNGIGIPAEHRGRLFQIFERLNAGEVYPGTGVGLAIVKKVVERMNGQVGLESAEGKGSTFWIELPPAVER